MLISVGNQSYEALDKRLAADTERARAEGDARAVARINSYGKVAKALIAAISECPGNGSRNMATEEESTGIVEGVALAVVSIYAPQIVCAFEPCGHELPCPWLIAMESIADVFNTQMGEAAANCFMEAAKQGINQPHQGTA